MLEHLPVCNNPLIVGDEFIADRRCGDCGGDEASDQDRLSSRYSHSIVAGGFELTS